MPSGARKRKAAKKNQKKIKPTTPSFTNISSTTSFAQGDENMKHHESDGGHNTDVDNGVEKSADMKNGNVQMEKGAGQDDGGVQDEGKSKPGNGFNQKNGDSSTNGTSSDSDGSRGVEEKITISENVPVIDLVQVVTSASEGPVEATHTILVTKESPRLHEVTKVLAPEDHKENEEKMVLSYKAPRVDTNDDGEDVKGSEVVGTIDFQARVTSAIRPEKATSWKSCCGLFEAFAGRIR